MEPTGTMFVMGRTGDTRITWDEANEAEVKSAQERFKELKKKGYKPYAIKRNGDIGVKLEEFDRTVKEIIFVAPVAGGC